MIGWPHFGLWALPAIGLWVAGAVTALRGRRTAATLLYGAGVVVLAVFVAGLWVALSRPPMRTTGETRLWYALFVSGAGWVLYLRWRFAFLLSFTALLATVFTLLCLLRPEIHDATLMPALRSAWFIPHVAIYMLAYALSGCALGVGAAGLRRPVYRATADTLAEVGAALLLLGMLSGAVWAKQAWGHYWTWDPKESWAALTWLLFLGYIHYRRARPHCYGRAWAVLLLAFLALQITWYGVDALPSSENSLHAYTRNE